MLLQRERPRALLCAFAPPRRDLADRTLSALAGALFLASWVTAYVGLVPPEAPAHRTHVTRVVEVRR